MYNIEAAVNETESLFYSFAGDIRYVAGPLMVITDCSNSMPDTFRVRT